MNRRFHRLAMGAILMAASGCSTAKVVEEWNAGPLYTCCNLRPSDGAISDGNWYESASLLNSPSGMLPLGTPVTVVDVADKSFAMRSADYGDFTVSNDYGTEGLANYMAKILVRDDPKLTVESFPEEVQEAIFEGRVLRGMTKQQVLMAIGYPPTHRTPGIGANEWTYWANRWRTYKLQFDREGRLSRAWGRLPETFGRSSE
jgi:outer membrane protein assembly factor BamE (lipoprotein component of BamABCDE complex)